MPWPFKKYLNADIKSTAAIALSKLATGSIPSAWVVNEVNLSADLVGNYTDTTVTLAQIQAIYTTAVQVVAAPGVGYATVIDGVQAFLDYGSAALQGTHNLVLCYTSNSLIASALATVTASGFLDASADALAWAFPATANTTPVANAIVVIGDATGNPTVGTGSVLKLRVFHHSVPTT
jgi:aspartate/tyrosine/aromatic aminotransferase